MSKRIFVMTPAPHPARELAVRCIRDAPDGYVVTVQEPKRTLSQNAAQWPILTEISELRQWPVNGRMETLTPEEWKHILTAAFKREESRIAMGYDGGMVLLGHRTREFKVREFSDWLEFLHMVLAKFKTEAEESK